MEIYFSMTFKPLQLVALHISTINLSPGSALAASIDGGLALGRVYQGFVPFVGGVISVEQCSTE